ALRPKQLRAAAEESALLIPAAAQLQSQYPRIKCPVRLFHGDEDHFIECELSRHLHEALPRSVLLPRVEFCKRDGGGSLQRVHQVRSSAVKTMTRSSRASSFFTSSGSAGVSSAISASSYSTEKTASKHAPQLDEAWIGIM